MTDRGAVAASSLRESFLMPFILLSPPGIAQRLFRLLLALPVLSVGTIRLCFLLAGKRLVLWELAFLAAAFHNPPTSGTQFLETSGPCLINQ